MGTTGYRYAGSIDYQPGEVILEVGSGDSTDYLAAIGPRVVTIDVDLERHTRAAATSNVDAHLGRAESVLQYWNRPIGFAWLDGYDWPYTGNPPNYYADQRRDYQRRGWSLTQRESRWSHFVVARLIADHARVIAFDDTWRTHTFVGVAGRCATSVPPATAPAPALAMDQPFDRSTCELAVDHPHHDDPARGWNGKGGTAIPYLLDRGFDVVEYGLGLVVLRRTSDVD